jgi:hypothetical protein
MSLCAPLKGDWFAQMTALASRLVEATGFEAVGLSLRRQRHGGLADPVWSAGKPASV